MSEYTDPTYAVRNEAGDLVAVTFDEYCEAFNAGRPTFVAYDPVEAPQEPVDWTGWVDVGYTTDGIQGSGDGPVTEP